MKILFTIWIFVVCFFIFACRVEMASIEAQTRAQDTPSSRSESDLKQQGAVTSSIMSGFHLNLIGLFCLVDGELDFDCFNMMTERLNNKPHETWQARQEAVKEWRERIR